MVEKLREIEALEALGKKLKGKREYRRLQCVVLRKKHGKQIEEIGDLLQLNKRTVYKHLERYRKEGLKTFEAKQPGRVGSRLLSEEREEELFKSLEAQAAAGELLTGPQVKQAYEKELGRPIALSTIYVVLERNQWSKKHPRPRHPKGDEEAKTLFKKT